jgi:hypothetical protein
LHESYGDNIDGGLITEGCQFQLISTSSLCPILALQSPQLCQNLTQYVTKFDFPPGTYVAGVIEPSATDAAEEVIKLKAAAAAAKNFEENIMV